MRMIHILEPLQSCFLLLAAVSLAAPELCLAQTVIPRTWDDRAVASFELPLADPSRSPKHVSTDYYYRMPVRPIFRSYSVYAPGREPAGYWEWLNEREPEVVWGTPQPAPALATEAD